MSKQLKLRRGTTAQHSTFTGAEGEVTVDTTKDTLVVHDGVTAGGVPLATEAALNAKQAADAELTTLAGMSSSRATYLASTQGFGFRNRIINGDMRIDQRNGGAAVTPTGASQYTIDRFIGVNTQSAKLTYQQVVDAPIGFVNSFKILVASAATPTAGDQFRFGQSIEGFNTADFGWGTANAQAATISFRAKASIAGIYSVALWNGANGRSYVTTVSLTTAWATYSFTVPGDTTGTWGTGNGAGIELIFDLGGGSNWVAPSNNAWQAGNYFKASGSVSLVSNAAATLNVTGVQLEAGTVATPFERRDYGRELAMCQRYYVRQSFDAGGVSSSSDGRYYFPLSFPVTMRATPTTAWVSGGNVSTGVPQGAITGQTNTVGGSPTSVLVGVTGPSVAGNGTGAVMYNDPIFQLTAEL